MDPITPATKLISKAPWTIGVSVTFSRALCIGFESFVNCPKEFTFSIVINCVVSKAFVAISEFFREFFFYVKFAFFGVIIKTPSSGQNCHEVNQS